MELRPSLSGAQILALEWLTRVGAAEPNAYRSAGIAATTVHSLRRRGFADWDFDRTHGRPVYFATDAGKQVVAADVQAAPDGLGAP